MSSSHSGSAGERLAAAYLCDFGYRVIESNFRKASGEVDIIAVEGGTIAFCEVKSWERMPISGLEQALSRRKQGRIIRTSLWFLQEHPELAEYQPRYDLLFVSNGSVEHIKNAFGGHGAL